MMQDWRITTKRTVAFFDIMGFRDMVGRRKHNEVLRTMNELRDIVSQIEDHVNTSGGKPQTKSQPKYLRDMIHAVVRPVVFSDSVLFVAQDGSIACARKMILASSWFVANALASGIPVKGAIAYGLLTADFERSIYFGQPLIDAFELQDELALYGAALHHTFESYLTSRLLKLERSVLCYHETPLKHRTVMHPLVDWRSALADETDPLEVVSQLYLSVSGSPRLYVDNTMRFLSDKRPFGSH